MLFRCKKFFADEMRKYSSLLNTLHHLARDRCERNWAIVTSAYLFAFLKDGDDVGLFEKVWSSTFVMRAAEDSSERRHHDIHALLEYTRVDTIWAG